MLAVVKKQKAEYEAKKKAQAKALRRGEVIIEEITRIPEDIRGTPKFQGHTSFIIKGIPQKCTDETTPVTEADLKAWIMFAIVEEDPYAKHFFVDMKNINTDISKIDESLKKVPHMAILSVDGKKMDVDREREQRNIIYKQLGEQRSAAEDALLTVQQNLKLHVEWRKRMSIEFIKGAVDLNTDTCSWTVIIGGTADALEMENLLVKKINWPSINLACGMSTADPPIPPWAGRGPLPNGKKTGELDYTARRVNITGARLYRIPAGGVGMYRALPRESTSIYGEQFEIKYGQYEAGKLDGYGISFNDIGVYAGSHEAGNRRGRGKLDLADGMSVVGEFGLQRPRKSVPQSIEFVNPYMEGEPHGRVEINFSDGGFYRGNMVNGRIEGQGDYQSAFNEVFCGNFKQGVLHGEKCFVQDANGDIFHGRYNKGELHGRGVFMANNGDSYDGYWEYGLRHGRGLATTHKEGVYSGYFVNDLRQGKGSLEFGFRQVQLRDGLKVGKFEGNSNKSSGASKTLHAESIEIKSKDLKQEGSQHFSDYENIFQGFFLGNDLINNGCIMNQTVQVPSIIPTAHKRSTYPIVRVIKKETGIRRRAEMVVEQSADMEQHVRREMSKKKIRIFNQQKHYTKKSMYTEDTYGGLQKGQLESKLRLRAERLKNMTDDTYMFKKASVPRLRMLNNKPADSLTKVFERIKPENPVDIDNVNYLNDNFIKMAISDFEEAQERQRYLKYDMIWQRAEAAYLQNRRSAASM